MDHGADLVLERDDETIYVQCKYTLINRLNTNHICVCLCALPGRRSKGAEAPSSQPAAFGKNRCLVACNDDVIACVHLGQRRRLREPSADGNLLINFTPLCHQRVS